jgi:hypothetical protein
MSVATAPVTDDQVHQFDDDGYTIVRRLFNLADMTAARAEEPGDVAIFGGFVPHRSAPNRSDRWRRQLYLSYNKESDGGPQRAKHYAEFHAWLVKKYAQYGKTETYFA